MSKDTVQPIFNIFTQSGVEAVKQQTKVMQAGIDAVWERDSKIFGRIGKGPSITNVYDEWMEEPWYQLRVTAKLVSSTLTVSGYLFHEAATAMSMRQHIQVGTILERPSGLQLYVSAVDYDNLNCTVSAHGNSGALSNDSAAITWTIIGEATSDYSTAFNPRGVTRKTRKCYSQIWKEALEMAWTTKETVRKENIPNEFAHQLAGLQKQLAKKIGMSVLRSRPQYSGGAYTGGLELEIPTMTGVFTWPDICYGEYANANVYIDGGGEPPTLAQLDQLAFGLYYDEKAELESGSWCLAVPPIQYRYINDMLSDARRSSMQDTKLGYETKMFHSSDGADFEIVKDDKIREDTIALVDTSGFKWGYLANDAPRVIEVAQGYARVAERFVTCQTYGTTCRAPRKKIAKIYNLKTTYA